MPDFSCTSCGKSFSLPEAILERYPGWTPRHCRDCRPQKGKSSSKSSSNKSRRRPSRSATAEENLRLSEVLAKYSGGPRDGIFTDGACSPNPGPGGWGAVWVKDDEVVTQDHGHDGDTTNNRMELTAIIHGLQFVSEDDVVTLYSDSKLCINTLDQWAPGWEKNGWKRKTGPIKNLELVKEAYTLRLARPNVTLKHIKAHSGERWNEYADSLATAWSRGDL